jgi:3-oxoacyl-[acyl-carrier-protein] synthase-3
MNVGLLGIGVALPEHVRDNTFWDGLLEARDEDQRRGDVLAVERSASGERTDMPREIAEAMAALSDDLFRGARLRRVLDDDAEVSELEADAGRRAIEDAEIDPDEIDLVLVHSLVPDRLIPSNAPAVQDRLGLRRAAAWSLDVGCASFQAQLVTAAALLRQGTFRRALVVQSHAGTRTLDPRTPASTNFGDAAAAAVVGPVPSGYGLLGHYARTDGSFRDGIVLAPVVDGRPVRKWWTAHGGASQLASFATEQGKLAGLRAGEFCREACTAALADAGLALDDVRLYIGNQSLGWFVDACRRALCLPPHRAFHTFGELANVGDAAILVNLHAARSAGLLADGDVLLLYSPSAGFTRTAVVYRWWDRTTPAAH